MLKSNGYNHPENELKKFEISSKIIFTNLVKKLPSQTLSQTASHRVLQFLSQAAHVRFHVRKRVHTRLSAKNRTQGHTRRNRGLPALGHSAALCRQRNSFYSATLLYTYISQFSVNPQHQQKRKIRRNCRHKFYPQPFLIVFFNFSHKRPTFAFAPKIGYTLGFLRRIAHKGTHGETGGVLGGGGITTLGLFHTFRKPCAARYQNGKLCRFWVLAGCTSEGRRKPAEQRCVYACRCSEASRPHRAA